VNALESNQGINPILWINFKYSVISTNWQIKVDTVTYIAIHNNRPYPLQDEDFLISEMFVAVKSNRREK
jgi:hypothetical protein